ncbi:transcription factor Cys6 [Paramyrothecium foliicola]|nr:transcription factor Cys6 [Paramyrothecium foliicola]
MESFKAPSMAGQGQVTESRIAPRVNQGLNLFKALIEASGDETPQRPILSSHAARFKLWAGSLGAHRATGNRSLEFRLRDASFIREHILSLLADLCTNLAEGISTITGGNTASTPVEDVDTTLDELAEYFQNDESNESEIEMVVKSIGHVIDCLLRLSVTIRNPAPHDQFKSRAGKEIIQHYKHWDIEHVKTKFPGLNDTISERLALATGRRRQYFKYRTEHTAKLAEGLEVDETATIGGPGETATTIASPLPNHLTESTSHAFAEELEDIMSEASGTSYATSVAESSIAASARLRVPPIPQEYEEGPFKCPFCHMFIMISNRSEWKRHVFGDLQPYICLVAECTAPDHLYSRRSQWIKHMRSEHWRVWHCAFGCPDVFQSKQNCQAHIQTSHGYQVSATKIPSLLDLSSKADGTKARDKCPLCVDFECNSEQQYERHVGRHMESLALFTLPSTCQDHDEAESDDSDAENDSQVEIHTPLDNTSPAAESGGRNTIWQGTLSMHNMVDITATAKYIGGANFSNIGPWSQLIPQHLNVAGRIQQQSANEYLCGLRYSTHIDVSVVSITPVAIGDDENLNTLINYFTKRDRYGVVGNKVAANVRDTYLVPVPAGDGEHPEFMRQLVDNYIPKTRAKPMLLAVFVYRNVPEESEQEQPMKAEAFAGQTHTSHLKNEIQSRRETTDSHFEASILSQPDASDEPRSMGKALEVKTQAIRHDEELRPYMSDRRPTYTRMGRRYVSIETLRAFMVDFEIDEDPEYFLIKRWVPEWEQDAFWKHSRQIREQRLQDTFKETNRSAVAMKSTTEIMMEEPKKSYSSQAGNLSGGRRPPSYYASPSSQAYPQVGSSSGGRRPPSYYASPSSQASLQAGVSSLNARQPRPKSYYAGSSGQVHPQAAMTSYETDYFGEVIPPPLYPPVSVPGSSSSRRVGSETRESFPRPDTGAEPQGVSGSLTSVDDASVPVTLPVVHPSHRYPCPHRESHGCKATFPTRGHASRHAKIHTAEKPLQCAHPGCQKKFTSVDNLRRHFQNHYTVELGSSGPESLSKLYPEVAETNSTRTSTSSIWAESGSRSTGNDEDLTIKIPSNATVQIGGATIKVTGGGELNIRGGRAKEGYSPPPPDIY